MNLVVTLEQRFVSVNGELYSSAITAYEFWRRYLRVFDSVTIVGRTEQRSSIPSGWVKCTGPNVKFFPLPIYVGPREFIVRCPALLISSIIALRTLGASTYLLRVPAISSIFIWAGLMLTKRAYALEVVGDPNDSLSSVVWKSRYMRIVQFFAVWIMKQQCKHATAAAYVTRCALQRRYPMCAAEGAQFSIPTGIKAFSVSDIELTQEGGDREKQIRGTEFSEKKIIYVGTLDSLYKGQEVLIKAFKRCRDLGCAYKLTIVGGGRYREFLEEMSRSFGIDESVCFRGHISDPKAIRRLLHESDLFVLPSYQEGLPRAMVEAMSCGVPCIGSTVGGIPEILEEGDMVTPGDDAALAKLIRTVLADPNRLDAMARRGIEISKQYDAAVLVPRRDEFYNYVRENAGRRCQ